CALPISAWRWHDDKDRLAFFDQRDWTVLELAGGKTLCVQVSNFFELERAFECDGKADVAAQEEHGGGIVKRGGKRRHGVFAVDDGLDLVGHCAQVGQDGFDFIGEHIPAQLREVKTQHIGGGN